MKVVRFIFVCVKKKIQIFALLKIDILKQKYTMAIINSAITKYGDDTNPPLI